MANDELDNILEHGTERERFVLLVQTVAMLMEKVQQLEVRLDLLEKRETG